MSLRTPILQFGTSRFLLAHVDLFVAEAMEKGEGHGPITVVQTTGNAERAARLRALADADGYPVRIRGLVHGAPVDVERRIRPMARALQARQHWPEVRRVAVEEADIILSNTGEAGYALDEDDGPSCLTDPALVPNSFPAKLLALLQARWIAKPEAPLSLFPCELIHRNGDRLRAIVQELATGWSADPAFVRWLSDHCRWGNSLVDRIVSAPIEPAGAIAEPYALWAIERQEGLVVPCRHEAVVLTDDLDRFETLKLHLLNLGHTMLAEAWQQADGPPELTVREAMEDEALRSVLEATWAEEVLPVFAARGMGEEAERYAGSVRDRFRNPFLGHRLSDIAQNHDEKKRRRIGPMIEAAARLGLVLPQLRLRAALERAP